MNEKNSVKLLSMEQLIREMRMIRRERACARITKIIIGAAALFGIVLAVTAGVGIAVKLFW